MRSFPLETCGWRMATWPSTIAPKSREGYRNFRPTLLIAYRLA
jgi:hypothetical protein